MSEVIEKRLVKDSTNSSAMTIVVATLAASLSGQMCYGFDENQMCKPVEYYSSRSSSAMELEESVKRIVTYTQENYKESEQISPMDSQMNDLKFLELSTKFVDQQVDLDSDIQSALNQFGKILGAQKPKMNRF